MIKEQDGGKRILNEQQGGKDERVGFFWKERKGHGELFLTWPKCTITVLHLQEVVLMQVR